jgi:hypothetical protein
VAPAHGLYFVGHWTRPGGGITPVLVSAMEVARRAVAFHAGVPTPDSDAHDAISQLQVLSP